MVNLTFVGDISFNDAGKEQNLDFSEFLTFNTNSNFTVSNLEALISTGEFNLLKNPRVTTNENSLHKLEILGINLVTLAHNHIYDAKLSGFKATTNKLKELKIPFIGAGLTKDEAEKPYILNSNNIKTGFLNYCTRDTNPSLPEGSKVFLNLYEPDKIVKDIKSLKKKCDHIILLLHWGGTFEGGYFPDGYQIHDAQRFNKAGASLIVGHHPHTLQTNLIFGNTPVYFSLGNFIFFDVKHGSKSIKLSPRRKVGGILKISLSKSKILKRRLSLSRFQKNRIFIQNINFSYRFRCFFFSHFGRFTAFYGLYYYQFKYINPLLYFLLIQEGGIQKFKNLNLNKLKRFLWKK